MCPHPHVCLHRFLKIITLKKGAGKNVVYHGDMCHWAVCVSDEFIGNRKSAVPPKLCVIRPTANDSEAVSQIP